MKTNEPTEIKSQRVNTKKKPEIKNTNPALKKMGTLNAIKNTNIKIDSPPIKKPKKPSRPSIPQNVKTNLWRASGGRCQFNNCNTPLWIHQASKGYMNKSYIAHIHAFSEGGARYDKIKSPLLEKDFSNLMLVCDECHRTFDDKSKEKEYSAERLIEMKKSHEERIELLTGIAPDMRSHVLLFGARIGQNASPLQFQSATQAILPNYYPSMTRPVEIGMHSALEDHTESYWLVEQENLVARFKSEVEYLKGKHQTQHFSIFGLAPQPLLIKLGTLLSDLYDAEVYQLHREPKTWKWLDHEQDVKHQIVPGTRETKHVALKLELSATITNDRIKNVLGEECSIWSITHNNPNNDYLKSRLHLQDFRQVVRKAFDQIKACHGENAILHVFPAMPVSAAIEFGRVWMPKADLPMTIYDQNRKNYGFTKTIKIN